MLRFSLPIAGSSLLTVLVMQADVLLLGLYVNRAPGVTVEAFGVFCAAAEIAGGLRKVRQVFDPIFAPIVATRAVSSQRAALAATVAGPGRWVLAAQLPIVGVLVLAGGVIISIYGAGFRSGALWLALLAIAHGTNAFAGLVETLLMVERPGLNLLNAGVTVVVQVVAGVVLIPIFGVTGAAAAMCIGFATQGVLRFAEVKHVFGWTWPWHSLIRPLIVGIGAFVPAVALRTVGGTWSEVGSAALFVALYALGWIWIGPDPSDREVWRRLFHRSK
jgi:O-antigen/teichoic acid export membrane protein